VNKVWLITGTSSGLGRALACAALAAGHTVAGTVRSDADRAAFEQELPGATAAMLDVTDSDAAVVCVAEVERRHGRIDVLVNNAGRGMTGAIEETTLDQIRSLFETNVIGPLAVIKAALPGMRARRSGHIVNVTSISGFKPWSGTGIYCASKFALEGIGHQRPAGRPAHEFPGRRACTRRRTYRRLCGKCASCAPYPRSVAWATGGRSREGGTRDRPDGRWRCRAT